jgi:hypothetical protein
MTQEDSVRPEEQWTTDPVSVFIALLLLSEQLSVPDVFIGAHATLFVVVALVPAPLTAVAALVALLLLFGFLRVNSLILRRTGEVVLGVVSPPPPLLSEQTTANGPASAPAD